MCKGENLFNRLEIEKELEIISENNKKLIEKENKRMPQKDEVKIAEEEKRITIDDFAR